GIIYAIYQIAKMVVQMVFACTEDEMKLQMYKDQKLCTASGEIGSYCSDKILGVCVARRQAYCCFSSPFARIFQQQARRQLNMNFGKPKEPSCEGLSLSQIGSLDFDKMNFGEWINMLKVSGIMAINDAKIEERYSPQFSTVGKLPGTNNYSVIDRLNKQTNETNVDEQRQYLIDNL
ncbi:conjugal transfer protein TraN, partial [Methylicorpusculum sp.]